MYKERIISMDGEEDRELYFHDDGSPGSYEEYLSIQEQDKAAMGEFECPRCHSDTFGRFEPFVGRGIERWCSVCGFTETNDKFREWMREHPDECITESEDITGYPL